MQEQFVQTWAALGRARRPILTIAVTYLVSVLVGTFLVHTGSGFALAARDRIVNRAFKQDRSAIAARRGDRFAAATFDFSQNLLLGAVPNTIGGLAIVVPYPIAAYRGWVGGIVTVDRHHNSRLSHAQTAIPLLVTLVLQLLPYSLAGGAGVYLGLAYLRRRRDQPMVLGVPRTALVDVLRLYAIIVPLFALASLFEFYAM